MFWFTTTGILGTNMNTAGTGMPLSSPWSSIELASSSVGCLPFRLCSDKKIRSSVLCCLWNESIASTFKFHRFLFKGVTTMMPDSHGIHLRSSKQARLRSSTSLASCSPFRIRVSSCWSCGSPAARTCSFSITTIANLLQSL